MLEEGYFSADRRPSDPTSSVRDNFARKEYNLAFEERESKSKSGNRNLAGGESSVGNRGQTTISVVNPAEYQGKEYDFVGGLKQAYGNDRSYNEASVKSGKKSAGPKPTAGAKKSVQAPAGKPTPTYFDGNKRVASKNIETVEEAPQRGRSKSFERSSCGRPRSANRERSRDYASTYSHYSSVYSRILNNSEANKIRKLVGEQNADLDVRLIYIRVNF